MRILLNENNLGAKERRMWVIPQSWGEKEGWKRTRCKNARRDFTNKPHFFHGSYAAHKTKTKPKTELCCIVLYCIHAPNNPMVLTFAVLHCVCLVPFTGFLDYFRCLKMISRHLHSLTLSFHSPASDKNPKRREE